MHGVEGKQKFEKKLRTPKGIASPRAAQRENGGRWALADRTKALMAMESMPRRPGHVGHGERGHKGGAPLQLQGKQLTPGGVGGMQAAGHVRDHGRGRAQLRRKYTVTAMRSALSRPARW